MMEPIPTGPETPIIVFGQQFVTQSLVTLILREKILSLSGDSAKVKDTLGNLWFQIQGKVFTMHQRSILEDNRGNKIAELIKKLLSLHQKVKLKDANGETRVVVMKESVIQLSSNSRIYLFSPGEKGKKYVNREPDLRVEGNFFSYKFKFFDKNNQLVARIHREVLAGGNILFGQDTYLIDIYPNVDAAFICFACMALDEIYNDSDKKSGLL